MAHSILRASSLWSNYFLRFFLLICFFFISFIFFFNCIFTLPEKDRRFNDRNIVESGIRSNRGEGGLTKSQPLNSFLKNTQNTQKHIITW